MSKDILSIFDSTDIGNITTLIEKLDASSFDYLKLEGDGVKITIGKNGVSDVSGEVLKIDPAPTINANIKDVEQPLSANVETIAEFIQDEPVQSAGQVIEITDQEGIIIVKSQSYGLFYSQPEPGAPPFVKLGDTVKKGDTLGLVEIMKTFNAVSAEADGEIIAIHAKNEEQLEPMQPLFSIRTGE